MFLGTEINSSLYSHNQNMVSNQPSQIRIKEETNSVPILPQPPPAALIIPAQVSINTIQASTSDPVCITSYKYSVLFIYVTFSYLWVHIVTARARY